ncbi:MAG TPA: hypothetical protein VFC71_03340 [Candidatus Polarisedimenticolia bacterium]|nr:hypothetical protein [Candidatus Polarisedimenticolia bacterium]
MGAPPDEYDLEAETILPMLKHMASAEMVRTMVHAEFVAWFDESIAGPEANYTVIADELWRLWQSSSLAAPAPD